jgi:hypothetical protein
MGKIFPNYLSQTNESFESKLGWNVSLMSSNSDDHQYQQKKQSHLNLTGTGTKMWQG